MAALRPDDRRAREAASAIGAIRRDAAGSGDAAGDRQDRWLLTSRRAFTVLAAAYIAVLALFVRIDLGATAAEFAVIVNRSNPVTALSRRQLRDLIGGTRSTWGNGRHVTVVLREPGSPEREALLRFCCQPPADPAGAVTAGEAAMPPKIVSTALAVKQFVFNVPGAIGVIEAQALDDTVKAVPIVERAARPRDMRRESK
jgi:hypothetical protein